MRARRAAAWAIVGASWLTIATGLGATLRGPRARGGLAHDAAAGGLLLGGMAAVRWAVLELVPGPAEPPT